MSHYIDEALLPDQLGALWPQMLSHVQHGVFLVRRDAPCAKKGDGSACFRMVLYNSIISQTFQSDAQGKKLEEFLPAEDAYWLSHHAQKTLELSHPVTFTVTSPLLKGDHEEVALKLVPVCQEDFQGVLGFVMPLHSQAEPVEDVAEQTMRSRFALALEYAPYGVCFVGPGLVPTMVNRSLSRMLGRSMAGLKAQKIETYIHEDDRPLFLQALKKVIYEDCSYRDIEVRLATDEAENHWAAVSMSRVSEDENKGYVILQFANISKRKTLEAELVKQATRDHLTGLSNRMVFDESLKISLQNAKRYQRQGAVLYIDLDDFKGINDVYGHKAGDAVLREVGVSLKALLRETDTVARIGGDEFAVIMDEADGQEAQIKASLIEEAIGSICIVAHGKEVQPRASVGFHVFRGRSLEGLNTADDVIAKADKAMYGRKKERPTDVIS